MKGDMGGAACVVGLMHAIAERKARVNAVGAIGLAQVHGDQGGVLAGRGHDLVVERFQRALGAADGDHMGAGLGQALGHRPAYAARGAGHEGEAAG